MGGGGEWRERWTNAIGSRGEKPVSLGGGNKQHTGSPYNKPEKLHCGWWWRLIPYIAFFPFPFLVAVWKKMGIRWTVYYQGLGEPCQTDGETTDAVSRRKKKNIPDKRAELMCQQRPRPDHQTESFSGVMEMRFT